jgi:hypothetical protein
MKTGILSSILLTTGLMLSPVAFADGDSSSDVQHGFITTLQASEGLIIKVPINEAGEELVSEAETRITTEAVGSESDYATAFDSGTAVNLDEAVTEFDVAADSATYGWYYGRSHYRDYSHYRTPGYWSSSYYRSYYPSYYSYGSYYPYYRPTFRTYYGSYGHHYRHYGHRYYHYGRRW